MAPLPPATAVTPWPFLLGMGLFLLLALVLIVVVPLLAQKVDRWYASHRSGDEKTDD
ncbi:hypothetical protein [Haloarchaeobius sp. TZWWS8]|uniref:hypothetical protein n=1 Tax=Haloarchaeobius sp. TZWWS8 TaxID=3446121 RepID=UPI003EBBC4F0